MMERTVPAFVPDFEDAEKMRRWEDAPSRDREMWARLVDFREQYIMQTVAWLSQHSRGGDEAMLVAEVWGIDVDEVQEIVARLVRQT